MDSNRCRQLFAEYANAIAYIDVELPNGSRSIGSAFHIGEGVFVTARHVVEGNKIIEVKVKEPVAVNTREFFSKWLGDDVTDEIVERQDKALGTVFGNPPLYKHYLDPLKIVDGPHFAADPELDVAAFRVDLIHKGVAAIRLGYHWDDWIYRGLWHLSDAIVLGYPPVPMVNEPVLIAARAEIHTFVMPRHARAVHFIMSATPRGGFSGGVAIHENGDALGVITSSFASDGKPAELGFFAVLSVEAIVGYLRANNLYPEFQRKYHDSVFKLDPVRPPGNLL